MDQSDLDFERFQTIVASFPDLEHVELQGEGEPLLHPRFFDMLQVLRDRNIRASFITNGSLITPERAAQIVAMGPQKVVVSMESADPAVFQALRGGTLEKVKRGLRNLIEAREAAQADRPAVGLAVTVLRKTRAHLAGILALYDELGLDGGISLQPLQSMPPYASHYDPELVGQTLSRAEVDDLWFGTKREPALQRIDRSKRPITGFYDELMAGWHAGSRQCPWLESGVYVNRHGQATACCMVKEPEKYGFGKPGEDGLEKLAAARESMRTELAAGRTPAACEGCDIARSVLSSPLERVQTKATSALRWATGRSTHPRLKVI